MVVKSKYKLYGIIFLFNQYFCSVKVPQMNYNEPFVLTNESLRMDGYYYRKDKLAKEVQILIFFPEGKLFEGYFKNFEKVNEFLHKNENPLERNANGQFTLENNSIRLKYYVIAGGNELMSKWTIREIEGKVLSDDTISINKSIKDGKASLHDFMYLFKKSTEL